MSFLKPDPPQPPDPIRTAAGATATNVGTAVANQQMNNINQITPQGALTYNQTGTFDWTDPTTQSVYHIPLTTATQSLSPGQANLQNIGLQSQTNLANLAAQQSGSLQNLLGTSFNPSTGNPGAWDPYAYMAANPDVAEFARTHGAETQQNFNAAGYLRANPDVAAWGGDPWQHWNEYGRGEGREFYELQGADPNTFALQHYNQFGRDEGRQGTFGASGPAPDRGDINLLTGIPYAQGTYADVGGQQRSIGDYGRQQGTFGEAGDITRTYGPADNFSADRGRVEEALYGRISPQLARDRQALETRLQDQGIRYGSQAYNQAMDDWNRQSTDARLAVTQTAGAEQQRMMEMAAQRAGFQNAAQQQAYTQALGRGQFANQAQAQQFQEMLQHGQFANQAQASDYQQAALRAQFANSAIAQNAARNQGIFNAQNQQRATSLAEQYAQRNQPINEISALMSGSQVKDPSFLARPNDQIATTDYAGLVNNRFNQDMQNYQAQSNNVNQLIGGLFGAIAGAGKGIASDRRVKEDVDRIGTIFAAGPDDAKDLPIYEYKYKGKFDDGARHVGPMAQDVEKIDKEAVFTRKGVKHIKPTRLGSILKVA
jgi:Chaperone of endosialidase